jgi:hypothetical protein
VSGRFADLAEVRSIKGAPRRAVSKETNVAFAQGKERRYPDFVQAAISEIQFSPDVHATYAKYRAYADPSGESRFGYILHWASAFTLSRSLSIRLAGR